MANLIGKPLRARNLEVKPALDQALANTQTETWLEDDGRMYVTPAQKQTQDDYRSTVCDLLWQGFALRMTTNDRVEIMGYQHPDLPKRRELGPRYIPAGWIEQETEATRMVTHVQAKRAAWLETNTGARLVFSFKQRAWVVWPAAGPEVVLHDETDKIHPPFDKALTAARQQAA